MSISKDELKVGDFVKIKPYNCYKYGRVVETYNDGKQVKVKTLYCKSYWRYDCPYLNKRSQCYEGGLSIANIERKCTPKEIDSIMIDEL